jgi:hypothetical protein
MLMILWEKICGFGISVLAHGEVPFFGILVRAVYRPCNFDRFATNFVKNGVVSDELWAFEILGVFWAQFWARPKRGPAEIQFCL